MSELKELFDMVTKQTEPDLDSWKAQETRQRVEARNRKISTIALVAALFAAIAVLAVAVKPNDVRVPSNSGSANPPPATLEPSAQDVAVVDLQGNPIVGIEAIPEDAYALSLSRDGTRIAFVTGEGFASTRIATIGTDGTGFQVLAPDGIQASEPAWSPDGTMIAFEGTNRSAPTDIYVMEADGSNVRRLTTDPAWDMYPRWSPDGSTIAYVNTGGRTNTDDPQFSSTADIWSIPAGGGQPTRLTTTNGTDAHPDYSPDGSQIAYFHDGAIWAMGPDGSDPYRILGPQGGGFTPRWSPDGTKIAYTTYDGSYRPYVDFGAMQGQRPLVDVNVVDVATGTHHLVGDVAMATDLNTPVWWSNDELLIRRVGH